MLNSHFFRFILIGFSNFIISILSFLWLKEYMLAGFAQAISYSLGIVWSFIFNTRFNFISENPLSHKVFRFLSLQLSLLLISSLCIPLVMRFTTPLSSWLIVMIPCTLINFFICKEWVFSKKPY